VKIDESFHGDSQQLDELLRSQHGGTIYHEIGKTIELDSDWEVGLSCIGVSAEVENAIAKVCCCNIYYDDVLRWIVTLPPGHCYGISHAIDALHSEQTRIMGGNVMQIV